MLEMTGLPHPYATRQPVPQSLNDLELYSGKRFGRYRLRRVLGEGASAQVWLAVEEAKDGSRRLMALKIFKPARADPMALQAVHNEAKVCSQLQHRSIVAVMGVEEIQGVLFIAMEYIDGITLEQLLQRVRSSGLKLPASAALDIGIQIAEALAHAHSAVGADGVPLDVVHRDLKPANVMISPKGEVKVTDFGIAKARTTVGTTQAGMLRGTPSYVAPEVWAGTRDFQPGLDLFALGAILWEMATGEVLLQGELAYVIGHAMNGDAQEDADKIPDRLARLRPVVTQLLRRDPARRTPSAAEASAALNAAFEEMRAVGGLRLFLEMAAGRTPAGGVGWGRDGQMDAGLFADEAWAALADHDTPHGQPVDFFKRSGDFCTVDIFPEPRQAPTPAASDRRPRLPQEIGPATVTGMRAVVVPPTRLMEVPVLVPPEPPPAPLREKGTRTAKIRARRARAQRRRERRLLVLVGALAAALALAVAMLVSTHLNTLRAEVIAASADIVPTE